MYLQCQINDGHSMSIACMAKGCNALTDYDFVRAIIKDGKLCQKYKKNCLKISLLVILG